jgi:hypothetical protein
MTAPKGIYVHAFQPTKVHGPSSFAEWNLERTTHMHERANGTGTNACQANSLVKIDLTDVTRICTIVFVPIGLEECRSWRSRGLARTFMLINIWRVPIKTRPFRLFISHWESTNIYIYIYKKLIKTIPFKSYSLAKT